MQFEVTAFIYDREFCKKLYAAVMEDIKDSEEITSTTIALRPLKQKIAERFMRLLTPII